MKLRSGILHTFISHFLRIFTCRFDFVLFYCICWTLLFLHSDGNLYQYTCTDVSSRIHNRPGSFKRLVYIPSSIVNNYGCRHVNCSASHVLSGVCSTDTGGTHRRGKERGGVAIDTKDYSCDFICTHNDVYSSRMNSHNVITQTELDGVDTTSFRRVGFSDMQEIHMASFDHMFKPRTISFIELHPRVKLLAHTKNYSLFFKPSVCVTSTRTYHPRQRLAFTSRGSTRIASLVRSSLYCSESKSSSPREKPNLHDVAGELDKKRHEAYMQLVQQAAVAYNEKSGKRNRNNHTGGCSTYRGDNNTALATVKMKPRVQLQRQESRATTIAASAAVVSGDYQFNNNRTANQKFVDSSNLSLPEPVRESGSTSESSSLPPVVSSSVPRTSSFEFPPCPPISSIYTTSISPSLSSSSDTFECPTKLLSNFEAYVNNVGCYYDTTGNSSNNESCDNSGKSGDMPNAPSRFRVWESLGDNIHDCVNNNPKGTQYENINGATSNGDAYGVANDYSRNTGDTYNEVDCGINNTTGNILNNISDGGRSASIESVGYTARKTFIRNMNQTRAVYDTRSAATIETGGSTSMTCRGNNSAGNIVKDIDRKEMASSIVGSRKMFKAAVKTIAALARISGRIGPELYCDLRFSSLLRCLDTCLKLEVEHIAVRIRSQNTSAHNIRACRNHYDRVYECPAACTIGMVQSNPVTPQTRAVKKRSCERYLSLACNSAHEMKRVNAPKHGIDSSAPLINCQVSGEGRGPKRNETLACAPSDDPVIERIPEYEGSNVLSVEEASFCRDLVVLSKSFVRMGITTGIEDSLRSIIILVLFYFHHFDFSDSSELLMSLENLRIPSFEPLSKSFLRKCTGSIKDKFLTELNKYASSSNNNSKSNKSYTVFGRNGTASNYNAAFVRDRDSEVDDPFLGKNISIRSIQRTEVTGTNAAKNGRKRRDLLRRFLLVLPIFASRNIIPQDLQKCFEAAVNEGLFGEPLTPSELHVCAHLLSSSSVLRANRKLWSQLHSVTIQTIDSLPPNAVVDVLSFFDQVGYPTNMLLAAAAPFLIEAQALLDATQILRILGFCTRALFFHSEKNLASNAVQRLFQQRQIGPHGKRQLYLRQQQPRQEIEHDRQRDHQQQQRSYESNFSEVVRDGVVFPDGSEVQKISQLAGRLRKQLESRQN